VRYAGFRAIKAGLQADTYIEAMEITKNKQGYDEVLQNPMHNPDQVPLPPPPARVLISLFLDS
jgi:hypothetical protein